MVRGRLRQGGLFACALAAIAISTLVSQHVWRENGLKALQAVNEPRVQLVANAIKAEISRQDHLPVVLSLDPDVRAALEATSDARTRAARIERLNRKLTRLSREADTRAMFVIVADGTVVASDDWNAADTLIGRNLADHPILPQRGRPRPRAATSASRPRQPGPLLPRRSDPRSGPARRAVVRIEFDALESAWAKSRRARPGGGSGWRGVSRQRSRLQVPLARSCSSRPRAPTRAASERYQGRQARADRGRGHRAARRSTCIVRVTSPEADVVHLSADHGAARVRLDHPPPGRPRHRA